jgi:hypothetical protein
MPPGLTIPSIFSAVDRFSAPLMRMRGALGAFVTRSEVGLARVERGFRRLLSPLTSFQNMMRGLGVYIGLFSVLLLFRNALGIMADFEQAQVNISAVTGKTLSENKALADQARVLALRYGEAAKSILELDLALIKLGFQQPDVLNMAKPIMTGAVALRAVPEELAKTTGAVLQAFKMPSTETQNVVDLLAKAADLSALDWGDIQTMLPRAMQSAALAGMDLKQLVSLFAMARNAQVHVASGSTAIKNMLIKGAIWDKDFNKMLEMIIQSPNAIKKAYKMFGSKTLVTALPLAEAQKLGDITKFQQTLEASYKGYAEQVATVRLESTLGKLRLFRRSWDELVLSIDDGTGPVGAAIKNYLDVGRAMLLISSNSDAARIMLSEMDHTVIDLANKYLHWLKIIGYVIAGLIAMKVALVLWGAAVVIGKVIMFGWSIALAIAAAAGWANVFALRGNIIALTVLRGIVAVATAAQWLWNAALAANPIGLIVIAIALMAALITTLIVKYEQWGAAASLLLGPLGFLLRLVMSFVEHWQMISDAFSKQGIIAGIKAIGKTIIDSILYPIQQAVQLLSYIPGFEGLAGAAKRVEDYRNGLMREGRGASSTWDIEPKQIINPPGFFNPAEDYSEHMRKIGVDVNINNKSGFPVQARSQGAAIHLKAQSTFDDF